MGMGDVSRASSLQGRARHEFEYTTHPLRPDCSAEPSGLNSERQTRRGIRQRRNGTWRVHLWHPITRRKIAIGTFGNEDEVSPSRRDCSSAHDYSMFLVASRLRRPGHLT